jgi:hypothetical protein
MPDGTAVAAPRPSASTGAATTSQYQQLRQFYLQGNQGQPAEPTITWGDPNAIQDEPQGGEPDAAAQPDTAASDDFGADDFGDDAFEEEPAETRDEFTSDTYQKLKEALKADPVLFKQVKKAISMNTRYAQVFKTPEEARALVDRVESWGGLEGIEQETQKAANLWSMLGAGDAAILDQLEKDHGDGLAKLAPHVLDRLQKLDPGMWNHKMAEVFMATVQQSGVQANLQALASIPAVANSPEAKKLLETIGAVLESVNSHALKAPARDLSPESKKLQEERAKLDQDKNQLYQQSVSAQVVPLLSKAVKENLAKALNGRKVSDEARAELVKDINMEFATLSKKDENFQRNAKALLAAGETEKFLKLVKSNLERTMPMAARRVWRKYMGISGISAEEAKKRAAEGAARTESGGGGATGNTIHTKTPTGAEVDWKRMREEFGRDKAEDMFLWQRKFYKKGDSKNTYSY